MTRSEGSLLRIAKGQLGRGFVLLALLSLAACTLPHETQTFNWHTSAGDDDYTYEPQSATFDQHRVIEDEELEDWQALTTAEIQYFLSNNPYGGRSVLADYSEGGMSAATMLHQAARDNRINPLVMLVRLQLEQSLVAKTTASLSVLRSAMGCGCPDYMSCDPAYRGFGKQLQCMASSLRGYLSDIASTNSSISGWGIGVTKTTLDGFSIRPKNAATAALYSYTPWRDAAKKHRSIWVLYASYAKYKPPSATTTPQPPVDVEPIVVDEDNSRNQGPHYFKASSDWTEVQQSQALYGIARERNMASASDSARFVACLESARWVTVSARWTAGTNRTKKAPYTLFDADNKNLGTVYLNQQEQAGKWVELGDFAFTAGCNVVRLSRWGAEGTVVVADAVRIE